MSSTYTPIPRKNTGYTMPSDGDTPDAASVRVTLEALADQSGYVERGGEGTAATWFGYGNAVYNSSKFAFSPVDQSWAAVSQGGIDQLETTHNSASWVDQVALLGAGKILLDVAFDGSGNLIVLTSTQALYKLTRSAYATWAGGLTGNVLTASPAGGALDFDPTSSLLVAVYRTAGIKLDTSANATAWTNQTLPAAWSGYAGTSNPELGISSTGKLVAALLNPGASANFEIIYSSNGTAWSGVTKTASILSAAEMTAGARITRPTYDPTSKWWFLIISGTTVDKAEVWKSTDDGATWSVVTTMTSKDVSVHSLCVIGGELVAVTTKGRIMVSSDFGATWRFVAGLGGTAGQWRIRSGGGGGIVINSNDRTTRVTARVGVDLGKVI